MKLITKISLITAIAIVALIAVLVSSCSLRGGEWISIHPGPSFFKTCAITDSNAGMTCTSSTQCKYACIVPREDLLKKEDGHYVDVPIEELRSQFNGTGVCAKFEYQLQGSIFELDSDGTLILKEYPIA